METLLILLFNLFLMAAGFMLMVFAVGWNLSCISNLNKNSDARLGMIGTFAAFTVLFSNPVISGWVSAAYYGDGAWSSPFVLHIPTAADFGGFLGSFFRGWSYGLPMSGWGLGLFVASISLFILNIGIAFAMRDKYNAFESGRAFRLGLIIFALTFAGFLLATFLFAYLLGTLMWLGDWWWAVLLLLGVGAGGGVSYVYDSSGRRVGTFYHD